MPKETLKNQESLPNTVHFSPVDRLGLAPEEVGYDFGAPERHIETIRKSVIDTLEKMGIPLEDVLFSGYNSTEEESSSMDEKLRHTAVCIDDEISRLNTIMADPGAIERHQGRLAELMKEREDLKPRYYFSGIEGLAADVDINPIKYASVDGQPRVGIYSKEKLRKLGVIEQVEELGDVHYVSATPEELANTEIATMHLNYYLSPTDE